MDLIGELLGGWGTGWMVTEQHDIVEDAPAYCRGIGTKWPSLVDL